MLSVPWYPGWQQQQAARRARARLNGALAKNAKLAGAYIIGHDGIHAQKGKGLYDTQDPINLSAIRNYMFMENVLIKVEWVLLPFHTVYCASQIHKAMHRACSVKTRDLAAHVDSLSLK